MKPRSPVESWASTWTGRDGWLAGVTMIAIFPSVLGVRQGTRDAADEFHRAGHEVHIVDIFEGRTFDTYPPAMAFAWEELGQAEMLRRALAGVTGLADGFAATGFSLGCMLAATSPPNARSAGSS